MRHATTLAAGKWVCLTLLIAACAFVPAASPAAAGQASGAAEDSSKASEKEMKQSVKELMQRKKKLQKEITDIRGKAFDKNPELEKRLKQLVEKTNSVMKRYLDEEKVDMKRLQKLHKELNKPGVNATRKSELKKEFDDLYLAYKRAKSKTSRNQTVMQMRRDFYKDLFAAMQQEAPEVKQKLQTLKSLEHRLRYVKKEAAPEELTQ
jgi:hypothetical protein